MQIAKIRAELMEDPVNAAIEHLVFGRDETGKKLETIEKIKKQDIIDLKGEAFLDRLPGPKDNGQRTIIGPVPYAEDGQPAERIAAAFRFSSADEMLTRMAEAPAPGAVVRSRLQKWAIQIRGNQIDEGRLQKRADDAIHNDLRGEALRLELNLLRQRVGQEPISEIAMKNWARKAIGGMSVHQGTRTGRFVAQEKSAIEAFEDAATRRDVEAMGKARLQQIKAFSLFQESLRAEAETSKIIDDIKKYGGSAFRKKIDSRSLEGIDILRKLYGFDYVAPHESGHLAELYEWRAGMRAQGIDVMIPQLIMSMGKPVDHRNISIDRLRDLEKAMNIIARSSPSAPQQQGK